MLNFITASFEEFRSHVTWPKWNKLQKSTSIIAISTIILSLIIFLVDTGFTRVINLLFQWI